MSFQKHIISKKINFSDHQHLLFEPRLYQDEYYRSDKCKLLITKNSAGKNICSFCCSSLQIFISKKNRKISIINQPAKLNAPIKFTSPERLKLTIQDHRLKCKQLEAELSKMRLAIEQQGEMVDSKFNEDFQTLFSGCDKATVPNFMKLFWEEQQKYIQSSSASSVKYHPMIIKFCLNLAAKSSSAYSDIRYDKKNC